MEDKKTTTDNDTQDGSGTDGCRCTDDSEITNEEGIPYVPALEINLPKTSPHMPFVYFVVAENKMPVQVSLLDGSSQACHHAIRTRKRFLDEKKRQEKRCEETRRRIREQNSLLGMCLAPVKDIDGNTATSLTNDLYPVQTTSSKTRQSHKDREVKKHTRFYGDSHDRITSRPTSSESAKKSSSVITLELPDTGGKNKPIRIPSAQVPSENDNPKRVQFSENSSEATPFKRCSSKVSTSSSRFPSRLSMYSCKSEGRNIDVDNSSGHLIPLTTSRSTVNNKYEMALPKIDLMGDMYDDVIIKAIDTYMTSRNVSAKRRPQLERRLISRLAMIRKYHIEVDAKIRQTSATTCHSRQSDETDLMLAESGQEQTSKSVILKPTAFHMVAPGMQIGR